jgi:uncharacterized membrane protein
MRRRLMRNFRLALVAVLIVAALQALAFAEQDSGSKGGNRSIAIFTEFSGLTVARGEGVRMDLIVANKGTTDETVDVKAKSAPKGWRTSIKGGAFDVSGVYVPAGKSKQLALSLDPDKGVGPGNYPFSFEARTRDGALAVPYDVNVRVQERLTTGGDLQVTTSYPVLKGQPDSKFEFSIDIVNKGQDERSINLSAATPENWEVTFQPANELKQISSFRMKGGQTQAVSVQVTPAKNAVAGEYPLLVRVGSGDRQVEVRLMVVITGTYRLDAGTTSGLLSIDAFPDKATKFSMFVKNTGSALLQKITFDAFKPEGWAVTFKPERIDELKPDEMKQVEVSVKPDPRALVGDYAVNIRVSHEKAEKGVEMRVIVKASATWAWVGIGLILFVIAGLAVLFMRLGRR